MLEFIINGRKDSLLQYNTAQTHARTKTHPLPVCAVCAYGHWSFMHQNTVALTYAYACTSVFVCVCVCVSWWHEREEISTTKLWVINSNEVEVILSFYTTAFLFKKNKKKKTPWIHVTKKPCQCGWLTSIVLCNFPVKLKLTGNDYRQSTLTNAYVLFFNILHITRLLLAHGMFFFHSFSITDIPFILHL